MVFRLILTLVSALFRPLITPIKPGPVAIGGAVPGQQGAMTDYAGLTTILANLSNNGTPVGAGFSQTLIPNNISARTYSGQEMVSGIIRRFSAGATLVDCTDTATNIVAAIPGAMPNQSFLTMIASMGSNALQVAAGTGVTMGGTNVIGGFSMRLFLGQVTGSSTISMTPLFTLPLSSSL
jgi:hypothetical protein